MALATLMAQHSKVRRNWHNTSLRVSWRPLVRSMLDVAEPNGEESFASTYAWIVHGPVRYLPDVGVGIQGIESYFTKPDMYRNQNEYRFWVGFNDTPSQKDEATISISIPNGIASAIALE